MAQADGSVIIDTKMNNDALEKGFERLKSDAESLGITCEKAGNKIKAAFADYDVSANIQNAVAKLEQAQIKLQTATDYFNDAAAMDDDKSAEAWAAKRESAYAQVEAAQRRLTQVIAAEANKQAAAEERAQTKATKATEREAAKKKKAQEKAYKAATKGAKNFGNRLSRIFSSALIFNALSSGLRQLTSYFGTALKNNSEFSESFAKLKGAFLTAAQPIYEIVVPALTQLVQMLTKVVQAVSQLFSKLTGKSTAQMAENAKALYNQADATKAAGDAAEKAKKQVAGFDEITTLGRSGENSSTDTSTSGIAANFTQDEIPEIDLEKILIYTSGALLALGVILTFSGANIPLGLGLMAIGAAGLATTIAVNWGSIVESMRGTVGTIVAIASGALLALGIILCATGAALPLGIGLIAAGAAGLVTWSVINRDKIVQWIQGLWSGIKTFWNSYIAPVFTAGFWRNLAITCGNGLITGFEGAINGIISMFETMINWIVGGLNKISFDVPDWVPGIGGSTFGFNIPKVSFGRVSIPRLAQGAVIPPNREFMAVLGDQKHGTNIEAPLSVIQEAMVATMEDYTNGTMAGFEALQAELQRLCAIVEGIEVGDSTIGQAANRYNQRMAVIRG